MYPDQRVQQLINDQFVPVRLHAKEQADAFKRVGERYSAFWTPTILVVDSQGEERHRIEGFVPAEDFLAQLALGLGRSAFERKAFEEAAQRFRTLVERHPDSEAAPEALYWAGVSRYKATNDGAALKETAQAFASRYTDSSWATKASIWRG